MSLLSALLVRDRVVPPTKLDEAIQRQVINGGDFETNLLEVGAIPEDTLAAYCAAVHDALAVSRDEVMSADSMLVARLARDVAEEHRVLPLRSEGSRAVLAVVTPPSPETRTLLETLMGAPVDIRVTTAFRLACGLAKAYGSDLLPRFRRLAQRIGGTPSGQMVAVVTPSNMPIPVKSAQPSPGATTKLKSALAALSAALGEERESALPPPLPPSHPAPPMSASRVDDGDDDDGPVIETSDGDYDEEPDDALDAMGSLDAVDSHRAHPFGAEDARATIPEPDVEAHVAELDETDFLHEGIPANVESPPARDTVPSDQSGRGVHTATPHTLEVMPSFAPPAGTESEAPNGSTNELEESTPIAPLRPTKTPTTIDDARARIQRASGRDEVIAALLEYSSAVLSYAALFVVHGDAAEGLDARGEGLDGEAVRKIAVPLDAPGSFRAVRERGVPIIGALAGSRTDGVVQADLVRSSSLGVALVPVHIGGRVALILWADNGARVLDLAAVDAVTALCGDAARAFERLIHERKRAQGTGVVRRHAAGVTDARQVTSGEIERRVAEQRGVQALRSLASKRANVVSSSLREEPAEKPAEPTVDTEASRAHSDEPEPGAPRRDSTRFARGGRVPISVDVIGPLPDAAPMVGDGRPRARGFDPRREPESPAEAMDTVAAESTDEATDESARTVAEIVRSGAMTDAMANVLIGAGDRALSAVFRNFPGPTRHDRTAAQTRLPPVGEIGPLLRLAVMFRQGSGPYLMEQLESPAPEHRYYATLCLGDVLYPPALPYLLSRLFDLDFPTRVVAVEVLRGYKRFAEFEQIIRTLRAIVSEQSAPADRRRTAANVLGELRDAEAIPALIVALGENDGALSGVARRALVVISRQDFGDAPGAWREWWERAAGHHRVEWLIEGLLHNEPSIRHEASEELKKLTGQFFGYYFNLPRREREKAYQRYREWWQREGRAQFSR